MKLNIVTYPNKILRTKLNKIQNFDDPQLKQIIKKMKIAMIKYDGIGLAANQVGLNMRLIIVDMNNGPQAFINPQIKNKSFLKQKFDEGCLSFPGIMGYVSRSKKINLEYQDENGNKKSLAAEKLMATVFQHELDHINGIIFTDKIKKFTHGEDLFKKLQMKAQADEK
ncbi:peptide deformylase [bacterium]|nr:peptide deformylase [bacterium]